MILLREVVRHELRVQSSLHLDTLARIRLIHLSEHLLTKLVTSRLDLALLIRFQLVIKGLELLGLLLNVLEPSLWVKTSLMETAIHRLSVLVGEVLLID